MAEQMMQHKADELAAKQTIPAGYKQTEVGVIPEDWKVDPLGVLINQIEYGSSAKSSSRGRVPVLRMGNLQDGQIDWGDLVYTNNDYEISKYELNDGDVLFNRTNSIDLVGKTALYKGIKKAIFAGYLIRIKVDPQCLDARYLNYFLNTPTARKYGLSVVSVGVSQANINGQKLKSYPIPYPAHVEEQVSIATALSDTDALITGLEQLIAKKQAIKTAAMQQLLTGRTRLPQFALRPDGTPKGYKSSELGQIPEDWEVLAIDDCATKVGSGKTPNGGASVYIDAGRPFVRSQNIGWGKLILDDVAYISDDIHNTFSGSEIKEGDVLLNITGASIGRCAITEEYIVGGNVNQHVCIIRLNSVLLNARLLVELINSRNGQKQIDSYQAGGNREGLNFQQVRQLKFTVSNSSVEQTAIATILSDMDNELNALEQKLAKARDLKQGMMQQLLTGRIRLPLPQEA
ncbi:restriction endonuclease subunit S [Aeromonas caviae]|uniref:restriction endonuclease subunit S n=2 Tax=Aeromonas caviae TaxID=648 RepID=UPI001377C643|nr:restriction endonuclease subunit S [Aeromonas caviae]MDX7681853.1 restriction endonuclease subunit S [Aeromonas caviae]MDX7804807.1 restriction endonuclease subunit S [Aeromonas caviae]MDX7812622.1 restriction endonuclease subunit S [Aeromonas caviae]MDX7888756.1 restriction endonuclease subunit S [Aeromonas caviae]MDY7892729.1 restriction endonuclease subunit S [Aeromonas caviae]